MLWLGPATPVQPLAAAARSVRLSPMLATPAAAPPRQGADAWAHEFKWDGIRALIAIERGEARILSRAGNDVTAAYPELAALPDALAAAGASHAVLDGEIVALDEHARPSFRKLQSRMHLRDPRKVAQLQRSVPVVFLGFDILTLDDAPLIDEPYERRREALLALDLAGDAFRTPPHQVGGATAMMAAASRLGLEGIVAKRLGSPYQPGLRSKDWLKIKLIRRQELVVGGWTPSAAGPREIGALLLGYHDDRGRLVYAGRVGTGLKAEDHRLLLSRLAPLTRQTSPFDIVEATEGRYGGGFPEDAAFVEPRLVVEVAFASWTAPGPQGLLRHASYQGLRTDVLPENVRREPAPQAKPPEYAPPKGGP